MGDGRVQGHNDLYDLIASLSDEEDGDDVAEQISVLKAYIDSETVLLQQQVDLECEGLDALCSALNEMIG